MTFIPYHSQRGTVDLAEADQQFLDDSLKLREKMRRMVTRWVPTLQRITDLRPEMHWCAYSDCRVVAFVDLDTHESFLDMDPLYQFASSEVRRLRDLGNYRGVFVDDPDPEDDKDISWRVWVFKAGDSAFHLNCSYSSSKSCRKVITGTKMVEVEEFQVVCDEAQGVAHAAA